jgi:hypothetical protein
MKSIYPEYSAYWHGYTPRDHKPHAYWKDVRHQRQFFDQLASKLNIQRPEQWYTVKWDTILEAGGTFVSNYYKGSVTKGTELVTCAYLLIF